MKNKTKKSPEQNKTKQMKEENIWENKIFKGKTNTTKSRLCLVFRDVTYVSVNMDHTDFARQKIIVTRILIKLGELLRVQVGRKKNKEGNEEGKNKYSLININYNKYRSGIFTPIAVFGIVTSICGSTEKAYI